MGDEAGYRQLLTKTFYADVAAFHNRYEKLSSYGNLFFSTITSPIAALVLNVPYANGIDGTTDGIEVAPDWKPVPWWDLKGNYSYLHLNLHPRPGYSDTGTAASYDGSSPHRESTVQSFFDLPHRTEFDFDYRYVSRLPAQTVKSYQTGDAYFSWRINGQLEFSATGQNLLQPEHSEFSGDNSNMVGIRRAVYAGFTWQHE